MKDEIAKIWVEALQSGKYKKGKRALCKTDTNAYCCLGVLCEVAYEHGIISKEIIKMGPDNLVMYDNDAHLLPLSVQDWAGMKSTSGYINIHTSALASINDQSDSFEPTIKLIEENVEAL